MKQSTKIVIGLSGLAVVGLASACVLSEKVAGTIKHSSNRRKVRQFVKNKLDGNQQVLDLVDNLSDKDMTTIVGILGKLKNTKQKIMVNGDTAKELTEEVKEYFQKLINELF